MQRAKDDPGVEKFLEYFYKSCIDTLCKPFGDIPEFRQLQSNVLFPTFTTPTDCCEKNPPFPCQKNGRICSFTSAICCAILRFSILFAVTSSFSLPTFPPESPPFFPPEINICAWVCFIWTDTSARVDLEFYSCVQVFPHLPQDQQS